MVIESMYKLGKLTTNELVGDLELFELHHLLPIQNQVVIGKGKNIALESTERSGTNTEANTTILSDKDYNLDEEEMALLAKKLTRFFPNKKTYFGGARRDSSTTKGSRYVKIDEESENETEKLSQSHVNKIK